MWPSLSEFINCAVPALTSSSKICKERSLLIWPNPAWPSRLSRQQIRSLRRQENLLGKKKVFQEQGKGIGDTRWRQELFFIKCIRKHRRLSYGRVQNAGSLPIPYVWLIWSLSRQEVSLYHGRFGSFLTLSAVAFIHSPLVSQLVPCQISGIGDSIIISLLLAFHLFSI